MMPDRVGFQYQTEEALPARSRKGSTIKKINNQEQDHYQTASLEKGRFPAEAKPIVENPSKIAHVEKPVKEHVENPVEENEPLQQVIEPEWASNDSVQEVSDQPVLHVMEQPKVVVVTKLIYRNVEIQNMVQ